MVYMACLCQALLHRPLPDCLHSVLQVPAKQSQIAFDNNSSSYLSGSLLAIEKRKHAERSGQISEFSLV